MILHGRVQLYHRGCMYQLRFPLIFDLPSALMTSAEKYHSGAFIHLRMPDKRSHGNAAAIDATGHPQICSIDICGNGGLPRCDGSFFKLHAAKAGLPP